MAATAIENDLENPVLMKLALNSVIKSLQWTNLIFRSRAELNRAKLAKTALKRAIIDLNMFVEVDRPG